MLESAKCDAWSSTELNPEEEIFGVPWKFGSYVDLLISDPTIRFSFEKHETFLKHLIGLLKVVPEIPASAEFSLRRCFYHEGEAVREGYYMTFYLFGYGEDEVQARKRWGIALKLVVRRPHPVIFSPPRSVIVLYFRSFLTYSRPLWP